MSSYTPLPYPGMLRPPLLKDPTIHSVLFRRHLTILLSKDHISHRLSTSLAMDSITSVYANWCHRMTSERTLCSPSHTTLWPSSLYISDSDLVLRSLPCCVLPDSATNSISVLLNSQITSILIPTTHRSSSLFERSSRRSSRMHPIYPVCQRTDDASGYSQETEPSIIFDLFTSY